MGMFATEGIPKTSQGVSAWLKKGMSKGKLNAKRFPDSGRPESNIAGNRRVEKMRKMLRKGRYPTNPICPLGSKCQEVKERAGRQC